MTWYLFALGAALGTTAYYAIVKKYVKNINEYLLSSSVFLLTSFILFFISSIKGVPNLNSQFFFGVSVTASLNIIATLLTYKAFKISDLSLTAPMTSLTPIFLILTSFLILGEKPSLPGIIGIILIVLGAYVLQRQEKGFLEPFKHMFKNKGVFYMIIVAILYSFTANYDKVALINSDEIFGPAAVTLGIGLGLLVIGLGKKQIKLKDYKKNYGKLIILTTIYLVAILCHNLALKLQIVPYVIAIKRTSAIFSVLFGYFLFKEKDLYKRLFGVSIMLAGVLIILLLA